MKENIHRITGTALIFLTFVLIYIEYQRINIEEPKIPLGDYYDYSILLYVGQWLLYLLLLGAGITTLFKLKSSNFWLILFGATTLFEISLSLNFYIVPSVVGVSLYILFGLAMITLSLGCFNLLKIKKISSTEVILIICLALSILYFPNGLITFYF